MPRPIKSRRVCAHPGCTRFTPQKSEGETIIMTIDEYEVIRLIDFEELTQEQCAVQMEVARTTVQAIYASARKKLAECIVRGCPLSICGGNVRICEYQSHSCKKRCCRSENSSHQAEYHTAFKEQEIITERLREKIMNIAVTYENGEIFQHFGHTEQFKVYTVEGNNVQSAKIIDTNGSGHGALADFLKSHNVDTLICGGIGEGAKSALAGAGIRLYGGVTGAADAAVAALLTETLEYNENITCDHHGEGHDHHHGEHEGCGGNCHDESSGT